MAEWAIVLISLVTATATVVLALTSWRHSRDANRMAQATERQIALELSPNVIVGIGQGGECLLLNLGKYAAYLDDVQVDDELAFTGLGRHGAPECSGPVLDKVLRPFEQLAIWTVDFERQCWMANFPVGRHTLEVRFRYGPTLNRRFVLTGVEFLVLTESYTHLLSAGHIHTPVPSESASEAPRSAP